jgi:hypothetical protein
MQTDGAKLASCEICWNGVPVRWELFVKFARISRSVYDSPHTNQFIQTMTGKCVFFFFLVTVRN